MTKLKLLKEYDLAGEVLPVDSIVELDDEILIQELLANETAVIFTEEEADKEEIEAVKSEAKNIKTIEAAKLVLEKKENQTMTKETKSFGETIKNAIETKAVDTYSGVEATNILGIVKLDSGIFGKIRKQTMSNSTLNIVYSGTQTLSTDLPKIELIGEATAAATTAPLTQYVAINAKWFATVAIANEYIDDVAGIESFVTQELQNKAELVIENSIINSTFANSKGIKGLLASTDTVKVIPDTALSAIGVADLHEMVDSLLPECQKNAQWVVSPTLWSELKVLLLDADNLGFQLIRDGASKELLGYPVTVSLCMPADSPILIGDFSKFILGVGRELAVETDRSAGFLTDVTPVKVSVRLAGGPACAKKLYGEKTYGAFVKIAAS